MFNFVKFFGFSIVALSPLALTAIVGTPVQPASTQQTMPTHPVQDPVALAYQAQMLDSQKAAEAWLKIVDQGDYKASWDAGAYSFQLTIKTDEWVQILNAVRKPLGAVIERKLVDIKPSLNPKGLPKGDYMVIVYQTRFAKGNALELITLQENQGSWKMLTYMVSVH